MTRLEALKSLAEKENGMSQEFVDAFYIRNGPCCAGCDWWRWVNSLVGECTKSAPVSGPERWGMFGFSGCSMPLVAGHVMTPRDHLCGDFKDEENGERNE